MEIPEQARNLMANGEVYFATSSKDRPNITVTQSGVVLGDDEFLICDCEMTTAKENILTNKNCALVAYDRESELGFKAFGEGCYYESGKYLEIAQKRLSREPYKPKGAVVIKIKTIFKIG